MNVIFNHAMSLTTNNVKAQNKANANNSIAFQSCYSGYYEAERSINWKKIGKYAAMGLGGLLISIGGIGSCKTVGPGERGVKIRLGEVQPEVYDEGIHAKWPFIESIKSINVKTKNSEDVTEVYTKDLQQAKVLYSLNYNLKPQQVNKLYQEVGLDYEGVIITPKVLGAIKDIVGKWNAQDLIANRSEAASQVTSNLQKKLKNNHIEVTNFEFKNIDYNDAFEKSIEEKVIAEQEALKAKNKTVQVEEEAKQKVIAAEADAKSMAIRADALTKNKSLVEYEAVQKWDGKLPQYMMGNTVPFVNLSTNK